MSPNDNERIDDDPIPELRRLPVEPSEGFRARLQRRIERREASNEALTAAWHMPITVLLAFLEMTFSLFRPGPRDRGGVQ